MRNFIRYTIVYFLPLMLSATGCRDDELVVPAEYDPVPEAPVSPQKEGQQGGLPIPAVIFLVGLAIVAGVIATLHITKKRQEYAYDEWEYEEDEP